MTNYVIGIDPGPVIGIVRLRLEPRPDPMNGTRLGGVEALQVTPGLLVDVLDAIAAEYTAVAVERFVVGPRAARSRMPAAGAAARDVIARIENWAERHYIDVHARSAADVKPWASDLQLRRAGLWTVGMPHARDAARHALFCAVKDFGLPNPLSTRAGAR